MIAWDAGSDIKVGPWPAKIGGWESGFHCTWGACNIEVQEATPEQARLMLMTKFHDIVVHEQVNPVKAHIEFSRIVEFRAIVGDEEPPKKRPTIPPVATPTEAVDGR